MKTREQRRVPKKKAEHPTLNGAQLESEESDPAHGLDDAVMKEALTGSLGAVNSCEAFCQTLVEPGYQAAIDALFRQMWHRYGQPATYPWQDLRQDTLARFWEWLPRYRGEAKPLTVLYRMAVNQMITEFRRRRAKIRDESKQDDFDEVERLRPPSTDSHEDACNSAILIERCRQALTGADLEIFEGMLAGKHFVELAEDLGISRQAAAMRWSRVKKMLRYTLENSGAPFIAEPAKVSTTVSPTGVAPPSDKDGRKMN